MGVALAERQQQRAIALRGYRQLPDDIVLEILDHIQIDLSVLVKQKRGDDGRRKHVTVIRSEDCSILGKFHPGKPALLFRSIAIAIHRDADLFQIKKAKFRFILKQARRVVLHTSSSYALRRALAGMTQEVMPNLRTISVEDFDFDAFAWQSATQWCASGIREAKLSCSHMTPQEAQQAIDKLLQIPSLTALDVSQFRDVPMAHIANLREISVVDLSSVIDVVAAGKTLVRFLHTSRARATDLSRLPASIQKLSLIQIFPSAQPFNDISVPLPSVKHLVLDFSKSQSTQLLCGIWTAFPNLRILELTFPTTLFAIDQFTWDDILELQMLESLSITSSSIEICLDTVALVCKARKQLRNLCLKGPMQLTVEKVCSMFSDDCNLTSVEFGIVDNNIDGNEWLLPLVTRLRRRLEHLAIPSTIYNIDVVNQLSSAGITVVRSKSS